MEDSKNYTIHLFLKFGDKNHIRDLYENGNIYLNPVEHFRKFEDNGLRGDKYEGITKLINAQNGEFEIKEIKFKGKFLNLHLRESYEEVLGNIYSLYCVSSFGFANPSEFRIDSRIAEFGTHCLMVKDGPLFLKKIKASLRKLEFNYQYGFVHYYKKNEINGKITLFQKPNEYEFQKEFRIYVHRESTEPLSFKIGSLGGIADIYETSDIIRGLRLEVVDKV